MTSEPQTSLFERIGGIQAVKRMVGDFYRRVLGDELLAPFFEDTPMNKLEEMQIEFFSAALGGPARHSAQSLSEVHSGRGIKLEHLQRFLDHLFQSLGTLQQPGEATLTDQEMIEVFSRIKRAAPEIVG